MNKIAAFAVLLMLSFSAQACGCGKPRTVDDLGARSPAYIFKGSVESVVDLKSEIGKVQEITFVVDDLIRGESTRKVTVHFMEGGTSCDLEKLAFMKGQSWLISANTIHWVEGYRAPDAPIVYSNNFCSLRERLDE
jgi:hypothetical protein